MSRCLQGTLPVYCFDNCHASNLQLNVQTIITDFEDAVLRAVTAVFGRHINHQGCFYHRTQASWRQIQVENIYKKGVLTSGIEIRIMYFYLWVSHSISHVLSILMSNYIIVRYLYLPLLAAIYSLALKITAE